MDPIYSDEIVAVHCEDRVMLGSILATSYCAVCSDGRFSLLEHGDWPADLDPFARQMVTDVEVERRR